MSSRKFGILNSSIGIISGAVGIYTADGDIRIIAGSILLIVISIVFLSSLYSLYRRYAATVVGDINKYPLYITRQAHHGDLREIAKLQKSVYPNDAVPEELYHEWYEANPEGFFVLEADNDAQKELIGHITFLSLAEDRLALYKEGKILETEIRGCDIIPSERKSSMNHLYVESVIVKRGHRKTVIPNLIRLLSTMVSLFNSTASIKTVYAVAATKDGVKTLKGCGFSPVYTAEPRKDGHDMYECEYEKFANFLAKKERRFEIRMLKKP